MKKIVDYKIIINIVCVACALFCVGLTIWSNFRNGGVITIDAYLGVVASLIGACTTIIVGFQIFNYFEFRDVKNKIAIIENVEEKVSSINFRHESLIRRSNAQLATFFAELANGQDVATKDRVNYLIISIILEGVGDTTFESAILPDNYDTTALERKYRLLSRFMQKIAIVTNKSDEPLMFWDDFKRLSYKQTLKNFYEISKMHYEIINNWENPNNPK
jgi:hypothetical protein